LNADGTVTVTPTPGSTTAIVFPYEVTTPDGTKVVATDTITPVKATDDIKTTPLDTPVTYSPLANDSVPAGSTITKINGVTPVVGTPIPVKDPTDPTKTIGTVTLNADGTVTVTPTPGSTTAIVFPYEVTTPDGTKVVATEEIAMSSVSADLSIFKLGDKVKTAVGDTLTYTITVKNNSSPTVTNSKVTDIFPVGFNVSSITCTATGGSTCPTTGAMTPTNFSTGVAIPMIKGLTQVQFTVIGTVATTTQLINKAKIDLPLGITDPNLENNVSEFPTIFDPPSGKKIGTFLGQNIVQWKQVWINEAGKSSTNATITDNIPAGTQYISNTLQCQPQGVTTTTSCIFNPANNSTSWVGTIGADFGNFTEETANNEVIITFQILIPSDMQEVSNQSEICTDLGCKKSDNPDTNQNGDITKVKRPAGVLLRTGGAPDNLIALIQLSYLAFLLPIISTALRLSIKRRRI
jgi:uncharacterized repeat protein (TIGR01451 family)